MESGSKTKRGLTTDQWRQVHTEAGQPGTIRSDANHQEQKEFQGNEPTVPELTTESLRKAILQWGR